MWIDNGGAASVNSTSTYKVENVTADHKYQIRLSDDDYCDATTEMTVWVDAVLQLSTSLTDVLCHGLTYEMEIDTTGTGAFRNTDAAKSLTVTRMMGGAVADVTSSLTKSVDKLILPIVAEEDATYAVTFTYGAQRKESEEKTQVIPAISVTLPSTPTICEGEETTLTISDVKPEGTTITWSDDPTISGSGETVTAAPTYNAAAGVDHQSTYTYTLEAYNETCNNKQAYTVSVKVDEPLTGSVTGVSPICEGRTTSFDASAYDASTYSWTDEGNNAVSGEAAVSLSPAETTTYNVEMTRGKCKATDKYTVEVTTNPVVAGVDSMGVRDRLIVMEAGKGTGTFTYWLDGDNANTTTDPLIKNILLKTTHTVHVVDEVGCSSEYEFYLPAPKIDIPIYFSPNEDGVNDGWARDCSQPFGRVAAGTYRQKAATGLPGF